MTVPEGDEMSDRRPENPELHVIREGSNRDLRHALPRDLLAAVRRGVESGTIEGEELNLCVVHQGDIRGNHTVACERKAHLVIPVDVGEL